MSNWQPIETLRDKQTPVLMRLPDGSVTVGQDACLSPYRDYVDLLETYDLGEEDGIIYMHIEPTHWQPFPSGDLDGGSND